MKPLLKAIIVIIIAVGVAVPSGYIAYRSFTTSNPSMINFVPENSSAVIRADYNGTQFYLFNSGNNTGRSSSTNAHRYPNISSFPEFPSVDRRLLGMIRSSLLMYFNEKYVSSTETRIAIISIR